MEPMRNLYLSRCPCEEADDLNELESILKISSWTTTSNTKKIDYRITLGNISPSPSVYNDCNCIMGCEKGSITPESPNMDSTVPGRRSHYKCNFKIWNNPELAKMLEDYFRQKNMLVEASSSDV